MKKHTVGFRPSRYRVTFRTTGGRLVEYRLSAKDATAAEIGARALARAERRNIGQLVEVRQTSKG